MNETTPLLPGTSRLPHSRSAPSLPLGRSPNTSSRTLRRGLMMSHAPSTVYPHGPRAKFRRRKQMLALATFLLDPIRAVDKIGSVPPPDSQLSGGEPSPAAPRKLAHSMGNSRTSSG
jgi:hypothetical protein